MKCEICNKELNNREAAQVQQSLEACLSCWASIAEMQRYHASYADDLGKAKAQLRQGMSFTDALEILRKLKMESAIKAMPQAYKTDLTEHDAISIAMFASKHGPGQQFVWVLRQHGTQLYRYNTQWTRRAIAYHLVSSDAHYYYYNGDALLELDNEAQIQSALGSLPK